MGEIPKKIREQQSLEQLKDDLKGLRYENELMREALFKIANCDAVFIETQNIRKIALAALRQLDRKI